MKKNKIFRRLLMLVITTALLMGIFSPAHVYADANTPDWYGGAYSTYNPFAWSDLYGQCTWYAFGRAYERTGIDIKCRGNANTWYSVAANNGFSVGSTPRANSIVVWNYGAYGHVGYVEAVNGNTITVSEANNAALGNWTDQKQNTLVAGINCYSGMHNWTNAQMKGRYSGESLIGYIYLTNDEISGDLVISAKSTYYTDEDITFSWNSPTNAVKYGITVYTRPASGNRVMVFDLASLTTAHSYNLGKYQAGDYRLWMAPYNSSGSRGNTTYVDFTVKKRPHTHSYTSKVTKKPTCTSEGVKTYTCSCGKSYTEKIAKTGHKAVTDKAVEATCMTEGKTEGSHCSVCGTVIKAQQAIAKKSHSYEQTSITKATTKEDGRIYYKCKNCTTTMSKSIGKVSEIKLSETNFTYSGWTRKPSVTVKDSNGNKLKKGTDYTVSYAKSSKAIGQYQVTIKFKGSYSGNVKKTYTISPKGTKLSGYTVKSKSQVQISWRKQNSKTDGYEIQYSTSSNYKKNATKTIVVKKNTATKAVIKSLKQNKQYYVRIRTYKNVKQNGKTVKVYSKWSKSMSMSYSY